MTQEEFHKRYHYNPNTDCLGEGGFGKVYKAYDTHLDHYVAIKMAEVKPHLEEVRLRKEVEVISKLPTHPNIAHYDVCYTFSTFAGEYDFGVLQYYEQGNLQQLLTDKQLTYEQKDNLLKQILEGIVFLHSHGIIHRDLKPQNILISLNRKGEYIPKITDFGISKKLDVNKSSVFTNSLAGAGTLSFASPEQLLGSTIRKNTDLWSFGVITCWMFTGKLPFNSGALAVTSEAGRIELFKQITAGDITVILTQIPADWRNLVKQCLVVDVDKRISGAGSCLEMVSGKVEVPIENHKSENTSRNNTVTSTATTEAPRTATNHNSTRTESSQPKPRLTQVEVDESKSHLVRNIFIGVAVIAAILFFVFQLNNSDESVGNSQQSAVNEQVISINDGVMMPSVTTNEPNVTSNSVSKNQEQSVLNTETAVTVNKKNYSTVTDIDGNVYKTVQIGNQVWMAENLKVTHYRNGDAIPEVTKNDQWDKLKTGAFCVFNNDAANGRKYGKLYNWYAVSDYRDISPIGWHIPTYQEWEILVNYLSGEESAGGKLKEAGTSHWQNPNKGANNSSGFKFLPAGFRHSYGKFSNIGCNGYLWNATKNDADTAWGYCLNYNNSKVSNYISFMSSGYSVRCIMD
jgi:uncharacterized protein (TIGR02145 family)